MGENTLMLALKSNQIGGFFEDYSRNRGENCIDIQEIFKNGCTLLSAAVRHANLENIKYLVQKGACVNQRETGGATPLLIAVHLNRIEIVKFLIEKGAPVNISDSYETPLMVAVRKNYLDIIKLLVDKRADINSVDINGQSPLFWAIKYNKVDILELLLSKGIPEKVTDLKNNSPLMVAIKNNSTTDIIQCLLKKGADMNESPLLWAVKKGQLEVIKILISNGANINMVGADGNTALATAVKSKQIEIVKFLVNQNANICKAGKNGKTPLLCAVENEDIEMVQWILDHGSEYIIDSVFLEAIATKNLDIVLLLHQKGAYKSKGLETSLAKAFTAGTVEIARYLLENGAPLVDEITYIIKFLADKNFEMVELITENGARLEMFGNCGHTALTKAVHLEDFEMVKYFIQYRADVNQANRHHLTPLAIAAMNNDFKIFQYLVDCGATIERDLFEENETISRYYEIARENVLRRRRVLIEFWSNQEEEESQKTEDDLEEDKKNRCDMKEELNLAQKNYYVIEFD